MLPLLLILIANLLNFGGLYFAWITVEDAARTGAQYMARSTVALGDPAPSPVTANLTSIVAADTVSLPNGSSLALRYCTRSPSNADDGGGPPAVPNCTTLGSGTFSRTPPNPPPDSSTEASHYVMAWVDVGYTYQAFIPAGFTFPGLGFGPIWPSSGSVYIHRQVVMRVMQ